MVRFQWFNNSTSIPTERLNPDQMQIWVYLYCFWCILVETSEAKLRPSLRIISRSVNSKSFLWAPERDADLFWRAEHMTFRRKRLVTPHSQRADWKHISWCSLTPNTRSDQDKTILSETSFCIWLCICTFVFKKSVFKFIYLLQFCCFEGILYVIIKISQIMSKSMIDRWMGGWMGGWMEIDGGWME